MVPSPKPDRDRIGLGLPPASSPSSSELGRPRELYGRAWLGPQVAEIAQRVQARSHRDPRYAAQAQVCCVARLLRRQEDGARHRALGSPGPMPARHARQALIAKGSPRPTVLAVSPRARADQVLLRQRGVDYVLTGGDDRRPQAQPLSRRQGARCCNRLRLGGDKLDYSRDGAATIPGGNPVEN